MPRAALSLYNCGCNNDLVPGRVKPEQIGGNCQQELCQGARPDDDDISEEGANCNKFENKAVIADEAKNNKIFADTFEYCLNGNLKDVEVLVSGIPDYLCVGQIESIMIEARPENTTPTFKTKKQLLSVTSDDDSYILASLNPHSEKDTLTVDYEDCTSEKFDIYVLPESVERIPGKINRFTQHSFLESTCPNYPGQRTEIQLQIDGYSGSGIQNLESNYIETQ